MDVKVSVVIPCYEYGGKGVRYLSDMFRTISRQTLKEVEVVITDHSVDTKIMDFCNDNIFDLDIVYYRNVNNRGNVASNKNIGMELARGQIVKMMYMDDYFFTEDALEKTYNALMNSDKMWLVCGTNHTRDDGKTFDTYIMPRWNDNMLRARGNNTMSGVSVISYKNDNMDVRWDSNTIMLLDVDFYYSLRSKYGDCVYLNDCLITQRVNPDALSSTTSDEDVQKEFVYCRKKHGITL
jgi:glycosyltransferase involved in cell wall biosynthesis